MSVDSLLPSGVGGVAHYSLELRMTQSPSWNTGLPWLWAVSPEMRNSSLSGLHLLKEPPWSMIPCVVGPPDVAGGLVDVCDLCYWCHYHLMP